MVVAVLGVVGGVGGVGVGVGVVVGVGAAAAVVEVEVAAAEQIEVVIESDFHIGICCGMTGFGHGSGHTIWASFPAMAVKEESGVFLF